MKAERLIIALDVPSLADARLLVRSLSPLGVTFKVGMELFYSEGPAAVRAVQAEGGAVFLDLKLHDIPHTVGRAAAALARLGVRMLNFHASGGAAMLREAADSMRQAAATAGQPAPLLLAVTVLTSLGEEELRGELGIAATPLEHALRLARLAAGAGMDGIVASAREAASIKQACGPSFRVVTPGVRPAGAAAGDQKRVLTPAEAIISGADYLVVGRPIIAAADPREAAAGILHEMEAASHA